MKMSRLFRLVLPTSLMLCLGAATTNAATAESYSEDPPDRVARISYILGDISLNPAGVGEWTPATLNRPLTTDDELWLEPGARAELQVGTVNIHLDGSAAFSFTDLSDAALQMRLIDGAVHVNVRRLYDGEIIEVDTPHAAIVFTKPGDYHIEVLEEDRTLVKNYNGEANVIGAGEPVTVGPREQITAGDSGNFIAHQTFTPRDEFGTWASERNDRASRSTASRHVAPDVIGYEDLDDHGRWAHEADHGYVWYPTRVVSGWTPYRYGHWTWISPWGWTWVDDAPWGFAPFHYGRWAHVHGRWGWIPGPTHVRAVYAPALVAWVGGPHTSISVSFGSSVGWFPLGPREIYVPGYRHSRHYLHSVNYSNTVIINNLIINRAYSNRSTHIPYSHRKRHDAVTVTSREAFVGARHVARHRVNVRDTEVRNWRTHNAAPAIAPNRASTLGLRHGDGEGRKAIQHQTRVDREVIVNREPPPRRASFEQERRAIEANDNRPVARREIAIAGREGVQPNAELGRRNIDRLQQERQREGVRPDEPRSSERQVDRVQRQQVIARPTPRVSSPRVEAPRTGFSRTESARVDRALRERTEESPRRLNGSQRMEREPNFSAPNIVRQERSQPQVRQSVERVAPPQVRQSVQPIQRRAPQQHARQSIPRAAPQQQGGRSLSRVEPQAVETTPPAPPRNEQPRRQGHAETKQSDPHESKEAWQPRRSMVRNDDEPRRKP